MGEYDRHNMKRHAPINRSVSAGVVFKLLPLTATEVTFVH